MTNDNDIQEVKDLIHGIDRSLIEARGEVGRLVTDAQQARQDVNELKQRCAKLEAKLASLVASQDAQDARQQNTEKNVERIETRQDRQLWGVIVAMGTLLASIIGLVLNSVFKGQ